MKAIQDSVSVTSNIVSEDVTTVLNMGGASRMSIHAIYVDDTPIEVISAAGVYEVATVTFDTFANTGDGDYIVIYDTAGLGWAVAADKTGTSAEPTGAIWTALPAARKAQADVSAATTAAEVAAAFELAFDALVDVPFATDDSADDGSMLITQSVFGPCTAPVVKSEGDLDAGSITVLVAPDGVESMVDLDADSFYAPEHGFTSGLIGQMTSSDVLPTGISGSTDYYVIVVDDDNYQLSATSGGDAVDITAVGSGIHTFTPTALAGSVKVEMSNDGVVWVEHTAAVTITASGSTMFSDVAPIAKLMRLKYIVTAGLINANNYVYIQGYKS